MEACYEEEIEGVWATAAGLDGAAGNGGDQLEA